jgi:hypothetical protein
MFKVVSYLKGDLHKQGTFKSLSMVKSCYLIVIIPYKIHKGNMDVNKYGMKSSFTTLNNSGPVSLSVHYHELNMKKLH